MKKLFVLSVLLLISSYESYAAQETSDFVQRAITVAQQRPINPELHDLWMRVLYRAYNDLSEDDKWQFNEAMTQTTFLTDGWQSGLNPATDDEMIAYHQAEKEDAPQL